MDPKPAATEERKRRIIFKDLYKTDILDKASIFKLAKVILPDVPGEIRRLISLGSVSLGFRTWSDSPTSYPTSFSSRFSTDKLKNSSSPKENLIMRRNVESIRPQLSKHIQPDVVTRREWRARFPSGSGSIDPLEFPLDQVIITHTDSDPCGDKSECTRALRGVQELFMKMGYHDIPYNFLITTEGDLFEGRAWVDECPLPNSLGQQNKTLVIGIIGSKSDCFGKTEEAVNKQIKNIIDHGIKHELIHPKFMKREINSWHFRYKYTKEYILNQCQQIKTDLTTD